MYYFGTHNRVCIKLADASVNYPRRHPARVHSQYSTLELHLAEPVLRYAVQPCTQWWQGWPWMQCVQCQPCTQPLQAGSPRHCSYVIIIINLFATNQNIHNNHSISDVDSQCASRPAAVISSIIFELYIVFSNNYDLSCSRWSVEHLHVNS